MDFEQVLQERILNFSAREVTNLQIIIGEVMKSIKSAREKEAKKMYESKEYQDVKHIEISVEKLQDLLQGIFIYLES